jgi:hypothetical protein
MKPVVNDTFGQLLLVGSLAFTAGFFASRNQQSARNKAIFHAHQAIKDLSAQNKLLSGKLDAYELQRVKGNEERYYLEDFAEVFNVEPVNYMVMTPEVRNKMLEHDPRTDKRYERNPRYSETMSELYGFYGHEPINLRQTYVKWAGPQVGYGVFAGCNIPPETFLGHYTGVLTLEKVNTDYVWSYPVKANVSEEVSRHYGVDARYFGNMNRFVNDNVKEKLNVEPIFYMKDGMWFIGYRSTKLIMKDEQLFVSYGANYWKRRKMYDATTSSEVNNDEDSQESTEEYDESE